MLRINLEKILDNGIIINHMILSIVSMTPQGISLTFDTFTSSEVADKALEKIELVRENKRLFDEFNKLSQKENKTKKIKDILYELQNRINQTSDKAEALPEYSTSVVDTATVIIPYKDITSEDALFEELIKLEDFKNATKYIKKGD